MKSYSPVRYDSFRKLKKFVSWPKPRQFPMCSGFLQPHEGCARATVSAWTFTSSLLKEDIQAISLKLLSRCSKSQEKQSYISATVDMALSIPALGLNRCTRHSWELNWWAWIFSQQASVHCSVPQNEYTIWLSSSAKHTEQSKAVTSLLSSLCSFGPGARAGLTSQVLTAISLAEPDQQRQGQHKDWTFFSATSMFLYL